MDNTLKRAIDITRRYAKMTWGTIAPLSTREAHAITSALRISALMPDGKARCWAAHAYLLFKEDGNIPPVVRSSSSRCKDRKYVIQFLQLVAGFMGWYEHGK